MNEKNWACTLTQEKENKMTKREFLTMVNAVANGEVPMDAEGNVVELAELGAFAVDEIGKLDAANAKKKERAAEKSAEKEPIFAQVKGLLTSEPQTAQEIGAQADMSTQKAVWFLNQLVDRGEAVKGQTKVNGSKRNTYVLA